MERLIALPDENLIKEFSKKYAEENSVPAQLYVDCHIELSSYMMKNARDRGFEDLDTGPFTPELAVQSGFRLFTSVICCHDRFNGETAFRHFQANLDNTIRILEKMIHVNSSSDIETLKKETDKLGSIFLLKNADALAGDIRHINRLREENIFSVALTHTGANRLADGSHVMHSRGITPIGREVIHALNENNILLDVAHLHPTCFRQLLDLVETPIISSCTGISDICSIPGNISMDQIKEIVQRGGMAGITFNPKLLSPDGEADIDLIYRHIDTVVQKYGPDYAGIGSGFCGFDTFAKGMEDISGTKTLTKLMSSHGYKKDDIDKIMGLNWLRLFWNIIS